MEMTTANPMSEKDVENAADKLANDESYTVESILKRVLPGLKDMESETLNITHTILMNEGVPTNEKMNCANICSMLTQSSRTNSEAKVLTKSRSRR